MTGLHILVPVKRLELAKLRLADALTAEQRAELVLAMLADVLSATLETGLPTYVLSPDQRVLALAEQMATNPLREEPETGSLNDALRHCFSSSFRGASSALVLLADTPQVAAEDLVRLAERADGPQAPSREIRSDRVVIVPDRRDDGTNALLLIPPAALAPQFGERSLAAHLRAAALAGIEAQVLRLPSLGLDVDTHADLALFMAQPSPTQTHALLARILSPEPMGTRLS
jgi:2-phospho-L-lactate guanylyltransferase